MAGQRANRKAFTMPSEAGYTRLLRGAGGCLVSLEHPDSTPTPAISMEINSLVAITVVEGHLIAAWGIFVGGTGRNVGGAGEQTRAQQEEHAIT